jgi:hypothetical protein
MSAELSDLEKAVADSEKSTAALIARANELANKAPLQTGDPLDPNDLVTNELGLGGTRISRKPIGKDSIPVSTKSDTSMNVGTAAIILLAAFIIYKIIR